MFIENLSYDRHALHESSHLIFPTTTIFKYIIVSPF